MHEACMVLTMPLMDRQQVAICMQQGLVYDGCDLSTNLQV